MLLSLRVDCFYTASEPVISGSVAFVKKIIIIMCETSMLKKAKYKLSNVTYILGRYLAKVSDAEFD